MEKIRTLLVLVVLALGAPLCLQGQIVETYTFTTNRVVPDGNLSGLHDVRTVSSAIAQIGSVKVRLKISGEFNGDLYGYVRHATGFSVLLNRPGKTGATSAGYDDSGFDVTLASGAANGDIHVYRNVLAPATGLPLTGSWEPDGRSADPSVVANGSTRNALLGSFNGLSAAGEWTLYLADVESGGTNMLREWALEITGAVPPVLAWSNPANITYGTALSAAQLNAAATFAGTNVIGTFAYTPNAGTILNAGAGQSLSVTFTPADTANLRSVTTNVTIAVLKAALATSSLASSANPALPGANVTFTLTLAGPTGTSTPSGSVNFRVDGTSVGSRALSGGVATLTTNNLSLGSHTVVAEYAGDGNFLGVTNTLAPNQVINTPPVAGADTIDRYPTQGTKVRLTTLLANDTDADLDTLNIAVSATSTNGASITVSNGWVFYTPAAGSTNVDRFSYTLTDGRGGSATGVVTVAIRVDNDPGLNLTITPLGGSVYRISGDGVPGWTYRLQYTETLTPVDWRLLPGATVTAGSSGIFEYTDNNGSATRYYRSVFP